MKRPSKKPPVQSYLIVPKADLPGHTPKNRKFFAKPIPIRILAELEHDKQGNATMVQVWDQTRGIEFPALTANLKTAPQLTLRQIIDAHPIKHKHGTAS